MADRKVDKPSVRARLVRKVRNTFPGWKVEFFEGFGRGIAFRVFDKRGQPKSSVVHVYAPRPNMFTETWLRAVITEYGREPESSRTLTPVRHLRRGRRRLTPRERALTE